MIRSGSPMSRGMTRSSERRNSATPDPQHSRVERNIDAGHCTNDRRPPVSSRRQLHLGLERLEAAYRSPVIAYWRATQVEIHDPRNSPVLSAIPATNAGTSASSRSIWDGLDAASRYWSGARRAERCRASSTCGETPSPARLPVGRCWSRIGARYSPTEWLYRDGAFDEGSLFNAPGDLRAATVAIATWATGRSTRRGGGSAQLPGDDAGRVVADHVQYRQPRVSRANCPRCSHLAGRLSGRAPPCPCPCVDALAGECDRLG